MLRLFSASLRFCSSSVYTIRSHDCGRLRSSDVGSRVCVVGWLAFRRLGRFLVLRDSYGEVQATFDNPNPELDKIPYESVICVEGTVRDRGKDRNREMRTGDIEINVSSLKVLNECKKDLPCLPDVEASEKTLIKYRYIHLRSKNMQRNLRMRSSITHSIRRFLVEQRSFVEVETPTFSCHTPGGAAEFIVPTRTPQTGLVYSLPQSPQQYKQLLMIGGIDRYFQIARCYRDEGSKLDRQPEFTQVDLEMSFCTQEHVMHMVEDVLCAGWPRELEHLRPSQPFPRISFADAIRDYGIDKPDLRIPWKIRDATELLRPLEGKEQKDGGWMAGYFVAKGAASAISNQNSKEWKRLIEMNSNGTPFSIFTHKKAKWFNFVEKEKVQRELDVQEGDAVVVGWGSEGRVRWTLGQMRNLVGEAMGIRKQGFSVTWVVDFPLFERVDGRLASCHHPFTAPVPEDTHLLSDPASLDTVRAQHFDLVLNGVELGGGSIRIHNGRMQRDVLDLLNEPVQEMSHLLDALESGAPPHGGFAFGLDRLVALLAAGGDAAAGIRDVIAFPKSKEGRDTMMNTPYPPLKEDLHRYGITITSHDTN